ncbi:MAG: hypothetical protein L0229_01770 [Blastocatellia bacterium]|nr:hypothetical protein [Blastocatellia bacterium]
MNAELIEAICKIEPRSGVMNLARFFKAGKSDILFCLVARATVESVSAKKSIVARATKNLWLALVRALKDTAKFRLSLRDRRIRVTVLCSGFDSPFRANHIIIHRS